MVIILLSSETQGLDRSLSNSILSQGALISFQFFFSPLLFSAFTLFHVIYGLICPLVNSLGIPISVLNSINTVIEY